METEGKYVLDLTVNTSTTSVVTSLHHISVTAAYIQNNGFNQCNMENRVFVV